MEVPDYLKLAVASLDLGSDSEVLDVAAGTGLLFRAVSLRVGRVVALDITPEMLAEGRAAAGRKGITNVTFEQGVADIRARWQDHVRASCGSYRGREAVREYRLVSGSTLPERRIL
jgi:tRNA/tmRNA/rRNA uracil-C5-methylase (TrmA/RlmC/RlmD family)